MRLYLTYRIQETKPKKCPKQSLGNLKRGKKLLEPPQPRALREAHPTPEDVVLKRVTLYMKPGCTACIKAKQFLSQQGVPYTERDMFRHPLNEMELRVLATQRPIREMFSFRSPSVKALGLDAQELTDDELLAQMLLEPRLIRRPLLSAGLELVVGADVTQMAAALEI
jgi:Spx/MgsR family transcriptional regulator